MFRIFGVFILVLFSAVNCFALNLGEMESGSVAEEKVVQRESAVKTEHEAAQGAVDAYSGNAKLSSRGCGDDARLGNLYSVLREISSGGLDTPLSMTPETYASTSRSLLKKLGDNVIVCPDNFIIDGVPMKPVRVDWAILKNKVEVAIQNGNLDDLNWMLKAFKLKPVTGRDVIAALNTYPEDKKEFLASAGFIPYKNKGESLSKKEFCGLSVMEKFGVTLVEDDGWCVAKADSNYDRDDAIEQAKSEGFISKFIVYEGDSYKFDFVKRVVPSMGTVFYD